MATPRELCEAKQIVVAEHNALYGYKESRTCGWDTPGSTFTGCPACKKHAAAGALAEDVAQDMQVFMQQLEVTKSKITQELEA